MKAGNGIGAVFFDFEKAFDGVYFPAFRGKHKLVILGSFMYSPEFQPIRLHCFGTKFDIRFTACRLSNKTLH